MPDRVLLVEDDPDIAAIVKRYLKNDDFEVVWCKSTEEVGRLAEPGFDVVLLDIMLHGASGLDICASLRAQSDCPIIFVSCLDDSDTIVRALEMGGDDYVVKPFDARVLVARIKTNMRRAGSFHRDACYSEDQICPEFTLTAATREIVFPSGTRVSLTPLEFQLLVFLMRNPGKYYPAKELYFNIWGKNSNGDTRSVIVLIHGLRKKIEKDPSRPHLLVNERGRGYAFFASPQQSDNL